MLSLLAGFTTMARAAEIGQWLDAQGAPLTEQAAVSRIAAADIVLLGEVHDSADIHRRQVALLEALSSQSMVLALEQLDLESWDALASERASDEAVDARTLADIGGFEAEGWGWDHYDSLFQLAVENEWPVRPLNLSRQKAMAIAMAEEDWLEPLSSEQQHLLKSQTPELALPEALQSGLIHTLIGAHCQNMERDLARRMARAQVARDVLMADAILRMRAEFPRRRVVAIMGNQHARLDRGVGYWLEQMGARPDGAILSVAMVPANLTPSANEIGAYHLRLLTEQVHRPSPCVGKTKGD
ncbi:ChaN family lipoprotein [Guyparkeria sp. 1SP6A2]|nr:ChaN family lipoprotein [Guyparkeria sp. 1SP6A2]